MSIYVFLGPTISAKSASAILDANYLPPVAAGDIQNLMKKNPTAIGIIDGFFEQRPAVFHKEILYALSKGVKVFGSSSMGALRAAELDRFGMVGIGKIYEAYRDGVIEDDDEVAIIHGEAEVDFVEFSVPMVNIRHGVELALSSGYIDQYVCNQMIDIAKKMFYWDRSWENLFRACQDSGLPIDLAVVFIQRELPNLKRDDATSMLQHMAKELSTPNNKQIPEVFNFSSTSWWKQLCLHVDSTARYGVTPKDHITVTSTNLYARLFQNGGRLLEKDALFFALATEAAELRGIDVTDVEILKQIQELKLDENQPAAIELARCTLLIQKLIEKIDVNILTSYFPVSLLASKKLKSTLDHIHERNEWLVKQGYSESNLSRVPVQAKDLLRWYFSQTDTKYKSFEQLSSDSNVQGHEIWIEMLREYLYSRGEKEQI